MNLLFFYFGQKKNQAKIPVIRKNEDIIKSEKKKILNFDSLMINKKILFYKLITKKTTKKNPIKVIKKKKIKNKKNEK